MVDSRPCLFRERIHFHAALYDVDRLGGADESLERSTGEQLLFGSAKRFVRVFRE